MTLKIDIDKTVIDLLTEYLRHNIKSIQLDRFNSQTYEEFNSQIFPERNIEKGFFLLNDSFAYLNHYNNSYYIIEKCKDILKAKDNTNCLVYYPNSFMGWHTNNDNVGERIYYTYTLDKAVFRYVKDGHIVDDIDNIGWTARSFMINRDEPLWHTVWSSGFRFSFGFNR